MDTVSSVFFIDNCLSNLIDLRQHFFRGNDIDTAADDLESQPEHRIENSTLYRTFPGTHHFLAVYLSQHQLYKRLKALAR